MDTLRSIGLFVLAALAEIGGAWLVWQGVREHRGWVWVGAGVIGLGLYGFVATLQPDANFGRILAAYGGVFVAGSLLWGMVADGFRPDRWDVAGAVVCLVGVALIMDPRAPRPEPPHPVHFGPWSGHAVPGGPEQLVPLRPGQRDIRALRGRGDPLGRRGAEHDLHLGGVTGDPGGRDRDRRHVVLGRQPVDDRVQLGVVR
jgi:small multidrug resistance family-3 protein